MKLEREIIATRSKTFSTAITGGAGITEKQISTNEKRMRLQSEKSELWSQKYDKLHKILEKIAKNKPEDLYEEGDIIKSTDNNAMTKLQQKLKMLQDRKIMLKNGVVAAKEYQKNKSLSVFKKYNIDEETTETIVNHIDKGGKPTEKDMYNWFTMPYLNRDIKEVEKRIAILEKNQAKGTDEILIEGGKIVHNGEAQRLQIFFDGIPSKEVREALKAHAFKWAPTAKAWQRTLTENAKYAVNQYLIKTGILKLRTALSAPHQEDEIAFLAAAGIDYFPEAPDDETQGLGKPVPTADIYKMVTDKIIGMLKSASPTDYHRAWKDDAFFIPLNYDSKKPYRGVNRLLLQERIGFAGAFRNPYFLTFKQIKKHKGTLKKGAKGYEVIYYSIRYVVPADKNSGRKAFSSTNAQKVLDFLHKYKLSEDIVGRIPMIRYYNVYNGADIENIDFKLDELQIGRAVPDSATENRAAQLIVENYPNPPAIKNEGNQAYYNPASDYIKLPKQEQFDTVNDYYRTLFHELTHSTGHNKRLNRGIHLMLEKDDYAKEELVAEFGAVFLSAWAGIMWYNNKNHAAYLKGWNSAIKEAQSDNKFLMRAASLAQQATDYILALDKDGNPAFLKKLQPKNTPQTPTDKSAPSDSSSNKNIFLEEYRQLKAKYPEHLIIVSMEDQLNYSMYGKDAVIAADILNLQLLKGKRNDEFSNSVGFKYNYLREYLEKLVKAGYKVALVGKDLDKPKSPPKKNTPKTPSDKSAPSDLSSKKNTKKKAPRTTQYKGVKTIPLTDLYTDEKRFQNRKKLNNVEVGKNKKVPHFAQDPVGTLQDGRNETLSTESVAKTVPNSALSTPEVFVEHSPDPSEQFAPSITPRNNSLANKMATLQNRTFETFIIAEPQMQAFLGDVERKNTGSTAITITGGAGSGKTRFAFQFINALAQNYKVGHASLEEQPDSKLYFDKVQQYLDQTAQANVEAPEIENMQDLQALIERNDVIVIDSFTKIREWDRNFLLDRDLRKKYNGKLFLIIFQQTVAGNMRGGTTSEFDGDIILNTQVFPDYRENYIYPSKNRYNSTPSEQLRYSVYHQQLLPSESTPPDSSPVTSNTYEVIY